MRGCEEKGRIRNGDASCGGEETGIINSNLCRRVTSRAAGCVIMHVLVRGLKTSQ